MTGKNVARKLQPQLIHWAKAIILYFMMDGWLTSTKCMVLPVLYSQGCSIANSDAMLVEDETT